MARRGVFDTDESTYYEHDDDSSFYSDDSRSQYTRSAYTETYRTPRAARGLPPLPMRSFTWGPPLLPMPSPCGYRTATPLPPKRVPTRRPPPNKRTARKSPAAERAAMWKWSAVTFSTFAGAAFIPAWIMNTICTVHLPGVTVGGNKTMPATVPVGFRSSDLFAFGAMPSTPWYVSSQGSLGGLVQFLVFVSGGLAFAIAIFKMAGARGRRFAGDIFGSLQCWSFNDESPAFGSLHWQVWWILALSIPAMASVGLFVYVWITTHSVASTRLHTGATPGMSLICVGIGLLCLFVASGLSTRHAILVSRLSSEDGQSGKVWERSSEPRGDAVSTLPPYTVQQEPRGYFSQSSHPPYEMYR